MSTSLMVTFWSVLKVTIKRVQPTCIISTDESLNRCSRTPTRSLYGLAANWVRSLSLGSPIWCGFWLPNLAIVDRSKPKSWTSGKKKKVFVLIGHVSKLLVQYTSTNNKINEGYNDDDSSCTGLFASWSASHVIAGVQQPTRSIKNVQQCFGGHLHFVLWTSCETVIEQLVRIESSGGHCIHQDKTNIKKRNVSVQVPKYSCIPRRQHNTKQYNKKAKPTKSICIKKHPPSLKKSNTMESTFSSCATFHNTEFRVMVLLLLFPFCATAL